MNDTVHFKESHPKEDAQPEEAAWNAVAEWYHACFTGLVLSVVTRLGEPAAAEMIHEIFSRQRQERFLPGLKKLGIDGLPPAVAAAQYHYLSNHIGGVAVEYMYESDRKAWVRYSAPRWVWSGTALCAIPSSVSKAMLAGWHAQNGVSLGNPRLGFVCTKQAMDGQSGLEGYYCEYDDDLQPHERLRFARHEDAPDFDPARAPTLPTSSWPRIRLAKAHRNYAMEYMRTAFPVVLQLWGEDVAGHILTMTGKLIGMQFYHQIATQLGGEEAGGDKSAAAFARFIAALGEAQDDACEIIEEAGQWQVLQSNPRFMRGIQEMTPLLISAWASLVEGALYAHNHRLELRMEHSIEDGQNQIRWIIGDSRA